MKINLNSKTVALLGRASNSLPACVNSNADEFWGVGGIYKDEVCPHLDRLYEIHDVRILEQKQYGKTHWDILQAGVEKADMVVMQDTYANIPKSQKYPLEGAKALCTNGKRGGKIAHYFMSSFDYMMAAAILEGFETVELYGFELGTIGTDTEYLYQLPSACYWIGQAIGRGIKVNITPESGLLNGRMYAFEGAQYVDYPRMKALQDRLIELHTEARKEYDASEDKNAERLLVISGAGDALQQTMDNFSFELDGKPFAYRAGVEHLLKDMEGRRLRALGIFNRVNAQLYERMQVAQMFPDNEEVATRLHDIKEQYHEANAMIYRSDGALQILERLALECDTQDLPVFEITDRFEQVKS